MFAIKEAQECVMSAFVRLSGGGTLWSHLPASKTPQHIFQLAPKSWHSICEAGGKKKKRQCGLCLRLMFSREHYNQLLPSQTSFPILWECVLTSQAVRTEIYYISLCLHSQIRATHWISFLRQLSLSLWWSSFFLFWFALTMYPPQRAPCTLHSAHRGNKQMNVQ